MRASASSWHMKTESIYFRDPNLYPLVITRTLRDTQRLDVA